MFQIENNKSKVIDAILDNETVLNNASRDLRNDPDIILTAVASDNNLLYIGDELKRDNKFMLKLINQNLTTIKYADFTIRNNKEIINYILDNYHGRETILKYLSEEMKKNRDIVLKAVKNQGENLLYANVDLRNDKEVVKEAAKQSEFALLYASDNLKNDYEIALWAVKNHGSSYEYIGEKLKTNKEIALEAVKNDPYSIMYINEIQDDFDILYEAIKKDGHILNLNTVMQKAMKFRDNEKMFKIAIKNNDQILPYFNENLYKKYVTEEGYAKKLLEINNANYKYLSKELKKNKELTLYAVSKNGYNLEYADDELKNDKEIVLEAVKENGLALNYASANLRKNKDIVREAIKSNGMAIEYVDSSLKKDKKFILEFLNKKSFILRYVDKSLLNDEDIIMAAVKKQGDLLQYANDNLKNNKIFIKKIIKDCGLALKYVSDDLKNDKEIVIMAIKENVFAINYASLNLKHSKDIIDIFNEQIKNKNLAQETKEKFIKFFGGDLNKYEDYDVIEYVINHEKQGIGLSSLDKDLKNDRYLVYEAVLENPLVLFFASNRLKNDMNIVLNAVRKNGLALCFASPELKYNKTVVSYAIRENEYAINYANDELKKDLDIKELSLFSK